MLAICKKIPIKSNQENKARNGIPHGKFTLCRIYKYEITDANYESQSYYAFIDNTDDRIVIKHFNKWFAAIV